MRGAEPEPRALRCGRRGAAGKAAALAYCRSGQGAGRLGGGGGGCRGQGATCPPRRGASGRLTPPHPTIAVLSRNSWEQLPAPCAHGRAGAGLGRVLEPSWQDLAATLSHGGQVSPRSSWGDAWRTPWGECHVKRCTCKMGHTLPDGAHAAGTGVGTEPQASPPASTTAPRVGTPCMAGSAGTLPTPQLGGGQAGSPPLGMLPGQVRQCRTWQRTPRVGLA